MGSGGAGWGGVGWGWGLDDWACIRCERKFSSICPNFASLLVTFLSGFIQFIRSFEFEWGFYAMSASEAIFRARAYSHNLFSPVTMIT